MDDIVRYKNKLKFSSDFSYMYKYIYGHGLQYVIDRYDVGRTKFVSDPRSNPMPKSLRLYIRCGGNEEMFNMLKNLAPHIKESDTTIHIREPKKVVKKRVKEEYSQLNSENEAKDYIRREEAEYYLDKLRSLNVDVSEVEIYEYQTPDEYMEVDTEHMDYSQAGISILCHSGTIFYQTMYREGILQLASLQPEICMDF